jgi:transcriptional regulator with XRE-family HTH domain
MALNLASRVRLLIDYFHRGSVNDAARALDIPQRTLADIASGAVETPRGEALTKIAAKFNVTLDWLLTGEGPEPDFIAPMMRDTMPEFRQLGATLGRMRLSRQLEQALYELPWSPVWAFRLVVQERHAERGFPATEAAITAAALHARSWSELIGSMIDELGPDAVAKELERNYDAVRMGFGGFAYWQFQRARKHPTHTRASDWSKFEGFRAAMLKGPEL